MITIIIPVGPKPHHKQWLDECLESVKSQTVPADEILLIDDGSSSPINSISPVQGDFKIWKSPCTVGVASAFNIGVALASNELVFMLGADDKLLPNCLEKCLQAYDKHKKLLGYYYVDVVYSDGRQQSLPCNAAMITKSLWKHTGGFPIEGSVGAPDAVLISILMKHHNAGSLIKVEGGLLYWHRVHPDQETFYRNTKFSGEILSIRNKLTELWTPILQ